MDDLYGRGEGRNLPLAHRRVDQRYGAARMAEGPRMSGVPQSDLFVGPDPKRINRPVFEAEGPMLDDVYAGELRRGFAPPEGLDVVSGLQTERARLEEEARAQNAIRILRELLSR